MLALKNAFLIDGTGASAVPNATVLVEGATITQAGPGVPIPEDAYVIDLQGKTLLPGFSDAHVHMGGSVGFDRPGNASRFASYDYAEHRELALSCGVTAVRSAGDYTPDIISFRDDVNAGKIRSPRVLASGKFLQAKGGHPLSSVYFDDPGVAENVCVALDEGSDIEAEVKKLVDFGVDWIKAVVSDDNKIKYPCTVPRLSLEQLRRIVDTAHKYGKPVMMHVDDIGDLADAVKAGADTVEHTINVATSNHEMTDEVLALLTSREVWVVPTLVATKLHEGSIPGAPPVWPALQIAAKRMVQAGVKLGVGCDSGIPFMELGPALHGEMELLVEAGLSPLQAVTAATGGNARMMRADSVFGTVAPGQAADLVVLGSNPLEDIKNTRDVRLVLRDGAIVVDRLLAAR